MIPETTPSRRSELTCDLKRLAPGRVAWVPAERTARVDCFGRIRSSLTTGQVHLIPPFSRRTSSSLALLAAGALLLSSLAACRSGPEGGKPLRRTKQRVFVIGFDGMDPTLSQKFM